ncbi:MAG TPA: SBBP repeat-containing protein [Pyrinomonadaceae bacterium]|nr:SBBP repeat-containing protein [Pyrinomonadaceae bacterium]
MKTAQKIKSIPALLLLSALPMTMLPHVTAKPHATATPKPASSEMTKAENYGKLPLHFEPNLGQSAKQVKFLSRGQGYTLFLAPDEAVFSLRNSAKKSVLRMKLVGADANAELNGQQALQGKVNYLIGNDRKKWRTGIPTFRQVQYNDVWTGIDMVWYGTQSELEYDFVVKPGNNVSKIRLSFAGAEQIRLDDQGALIINSNGEEVKHSAPTIYQETNGNRVSVSGKYVIKETNEIGFEVGDYDRSKPLIIDPVLIYSSYIGGNADDLGFAVAANNNGEAYLAGETFSSEVTFPLKNAIQGTQFTTSLAFITKLNANGTDTIYSTFLGDADGLCTLDVCGTEVRGIAVTEDGRAAITGATVNNDNESDFPLTDNKFQGNGFCLGVCGLELDRRIDAFVTMLSADGSDLIYSTLFGGGASVSAVGLRAFDAGNAIAIDSSNRIYITGQTASNNLPTKHAFQWSRHSEYQGFDAFVAVFNPTATSGNASLLYSSYHGGDGDDIGKGIAVDNDRNAYFVGSTASTDMETKSPSSLAPLRASFQGGSTDGFIVKVDTESDGNASLTYSTYFGGNINDRVESVAVDAQQRAYITGASNSSPSSFPLKNAFDSNQTNGEAFVAKLNADGTALFYCSFLGGDNANTSNDGEEGLGIVIDAGGNVYVTGRTTSGASFPAVLPLALQLQGTAFLTKIEASISNNTVPKILYSTTFGGSGARGESVALDTKGNVYLGGTTPGTLPTTAGAFDTTFNGGSSDAFVAKFNTTFNDTVGVFTPATNQFQLRDSNSTGPADHVITFGQKGDQPIVGDWNGSGIDQPGVFRPSTGQFILQINALKTITVNFGGSVNIAVVGDWDGNGIDTPGVFNPANGDWFVTNGINGANINNSTPVANFIFTFGQNGDTPIAGDWDGNGLDSVGLFRTGTSTFLLSNGFQGSVDIKPFVFGSLGSKPIAGDWDGDGIDSVGVFTQTTGTMSLTNINRVGAVADIVFTFGVNGDIPLAGDWDGKPSLP